MKKNLFGTDGIRGRVGVHPFTRDALPELGSALGAWILKTYGPGASVLLAHDTRNSCSWVKAALTSGMLLHPLHLVDAQVLPTPAVLCLIQKKLSHFSCGIIISASHNPYQDNGIKIIDAATGKISHADETTITELFYADSVEQQQSLFGTSTALANASELYAETVTALFPPLFLRGKTIVLDCAHGATSSLAETIFTACGAKVIVINSQPTGTNINECCGALHPEELQRAVLEHKADAGFAFDGDGDRVIAVSSHGEVKNGDDILALLSQHPLYSSQPVVIGTIMSNQGFELFLRNNGKLLVRAAVGDKYVAQELNAKNLLLGGEQSGHIIVRDYLPSGDGIVAALRTVEALQHTHNPTMETFTKYPQVLLNIAVPTKKDLSLSPFREIIEVNQSQLSTGRLLVRYSGTESVLRIMAEAENLEQAQSTAALVSQQLAHALSQ
jgi:phosphoglucosamine mutase